MTHTASAGFEQNGSTQKRGCGLSSVGRWSAWEIGAMVAGFVVFWPLGLIALFLKWKNGEMWKGSADLTVTHKSGTWRAPCSILGLISWNRM